MVKLYPAVLFIYKAIKRKFAQQIRLITLNTLGSIILLIRHLT